MSHKEVSAIDKKLKSARWSVHSGFFFPARDGEVPPQDENKAAE
jgi:hypothetical protein